MKYHFANGVQIDMRVIDEEKKILRSVGFYDVELDSTEYYHVFDEDWKCLELELVR